MNTTTAYLNVNGIEREFLVYDNQTSRHMLTLIMEGTAYPLIPLVDPVKKVLDVGAKRVADARLDGVDALIGILHHHVTGAADDIGIVADAAIHGIGTGAAVEQVIAAVAVERVVAAEAVEHVAEGGALQGVDTRGAGADGGDRVGLSRTGLFFTGRHSDYRCGDTFYPSWASDGNLYSPWTDGKTDGVVSQSGIGANALTGHAVMIGDDPLKLEIRNTSAPKVASALPYHGR